MSCAAFFWRPAQGQFPHVVHCLQLSLMSAILAMIVYYERNKDEIGVHCLQWSLQANISTGCGACLALVTG